MPSGQPMLSHISCKLNIEWKEKCPSIFLFPRKWSQYRKMSVFPVFAWKAQTYRVQNISVSVLMIMMRAGKFLPTPRKRNTPYCDCEFRTEKEKKRLVYWKNKKTKGKKKRKKQNWKTSHYHILLISLKAGFYNCAWGFPNETSIVSLKVSPNFC